MILVVEDHDDTRNALIKFLREHEFVTVGASDAVEALDLMRLKAPFLVILDWHLPDKSGLEVLSEMQKDSNLKNTPTIFYTGDGDPHLRDEALKAGARKVLVKGSDWEKLVDEIAELTSVSPSQYS